MADHKNPEPWVCPWDICNHEAAQECRAERHPRKGCGGRFPHDMTPAQAKESIKLPTPKEHPQMPHSRDGGPHA